MAGRFQRRRIEGEPRGFLPRGDDATPRWARVRDLLAGGREEIDQEGLLAERTLLVEPCSPRDEAHR
jgi:hypothetical protein